MLRKTMSIAALILCLAGFARADDSALFNRVPSGANALVVVDVKKAVGSSLATKEGWGKNRADASLFLNPAANRIVIASHVDLTSMDAHWSVALLDLAKPPSLAAITLAESGYTDTLGGKPAVHSDRNAYFIQLDTQLLGVVAPADRQFTDRWAAIPPAPGTLTPYLQTAATGNKSTIVMSMDLSNAANTTGVRRTFAADPSLLLLAKDVDLKTLSETIGGIKGITLSVDIDAEITATATLEFSASAAVLAKIGQPLLLEFLAKNGMQLDDLKAWTATVEGTKLTTTGKLTTPGLKRILSLVEPPTPPDSAEALAAAGGSEPKVAANPKAEASQKYYKAVAMVLDRYGPAPTIGDMAGWLKRDAQRINQLSLVNVDPELAAWGGEVSANLIQASGVAAVGQMQVSARAASVALSTTVTYNDTSAAQASANRAEYENALNQRRAAALDAKANASQAGVKFIAEAQASRTKIRAAMVARYNVDF